MVRHFTSASYAARLVAGVLILVLLTTLSAGAPAYWLTRNELTKQAQARLSAMRTATQSLLRAEQGQLASLTALLVERPTLRRLLQQDSWADLPPYLRAFQVQSGLDIVHLCAVEAAGAGAGATASHTAPLPACPQPLPAGFMLYQGQPALLTSRPIALGGAPLWQAVAVTGQWLDRPFLRQLASATGAVYSILLADGTRGASSAREGEAPAAADARAVAAGDSASQFPLQVGGHRYFAALLPLAADLGRPVLHLELALPVDDLYATQRGARAVLALSTGAVALLGALLGIWSVRRLTGPLARLTQAADAISRGDLATPAPQAARPREVRTLAAALQRSQASMLSALDDAARARDWLDGLVRSIVEGVVTLDAAGRVTFINERAAALAVIPAVLCGVYLAEYVTRRTRTLLKPIIDLLVGIPSVVYGLWGILFVVPLVRDQVGPWSDRTLGQVIPAFSRTNPSGYGLLAAGFVLAVMVFPLIVAVTEEVMRSVPREMREALLSLGATRWEATRCVIRRAGLSGILAAVVLGFSRAFGETLAVVMVVGNVAQVPRSLFDAVYPLPALIANNYGEMMSVPLYESALMMAALLLLLVVVGFNVAAQWIVKRLVRRRLA